MFTKLVILVDPMRNARVIAACWLVSFASGAEPPTVGPQPSSAVTPLQRESAPAPPMQFSRSFVHRMTSKAVGDEFAIQVRLPESYEKGQGRYPVVYVLDADVWSGVAADMADNLPAGKEMPEVIVVGLSYGGTLDDWGEKRKRDYTPTPERSKPSAELPLAGGAAKFQEFIAAELMPFVDSHYRTKEDDRALVGYSYGGLLGAYTLFTRPELFQRYILIAPSLHWDERCLWKTEAAYGAAHTTLPVVVFTAIGDRDSQKKIIEPWHDFNRLIESRHYEGLRWFTQVFPEETHLSTYPSALTRGLRVVYGTAKPENKKEEQK
jgi:predicted alpha/beta superfamily hydrolase